MREVRLHLAICEVEQSARILIDAEDLKANRFGSGDRLKSFVIFRSLPS